jgi:hypothetical protein
MTQGQNILLAERILTCVLSKCKDVERFQQVFSHIEILPKNSQNNKQKGQPCLEPTFFRGTVTDIYGTVRYPTNVSLVRLSMTLPPPPLSASNGVSF